MKTPKYGSLAMTDASTMRNPEIRFTNRSGSTTPQLAFLGDIDAVATECSADIVIFLRMLSISESVAAAAKGPWTFVMMFLQKGA